MSSVQIAQSSLIGVDELDSENVATFSGADLKLEEKPFLAHFNLRGSAQSAEFGSAFSSIMESKLPLTPNTVSESNDFLVCWLGPDEWLIVSQRQDPLSKLQILRGALQGQHVALTDVSSAQTVISVSGDNASALLAKATPLDLNRERFGLSQCAQTLFAKTSALIVPRAGIVANELIYDLIVRRSFVDYAWRWLIDAASEFES